MVLFKERKRKLYCNDRMLAMPSKDANRFIKEHS